MSLQLARVLHPLETRGVPDRTAASAFTPLALLAAVTLPVISVVTGHPAVILGVAVAAVACPFLLRTDGAPIVLGIAALPLSTLLAQYGSGVGGYKIIAIYAVACWLLGYLAGWQTYRYRPAPADAAVVGLFLVALVNIVFLSQAGKLSLLQWYGGDLALYVWVRGTLFSVRRLWTTLFAFSAASAVAALVGFWLYGAGLAPVDERLVRLALPGQNTNAVGSIMLLGFGFSLALLLYERRPVLRLCLAAFLAASALATILTFSRGAFVGMVAMLAAGLAMSRSWRVRIASAGAALAAVIGVWTGIVDSAGLSSYVARVTAITSFSAHTTAERNVLWSMGWQAFTSHWLFGLGIGNFDLPRFWYPLAFKFAAPRYFFLYPQQVHSFYIGWAADAGLIAVALLGVALVLVVRTLFRASRAAHDSPIASASSQALLVGFVGYFVFLASSPEQGSQLPYVLMAMAACLGAFVGVPAPTAAPGRSPEPEPTVLT